MADFIKKASELYRQIGQLPNAIGGRIFKSENDLYEVEVKWSQKDLDRGLKLTYAKSTLVRLNDVGIPCLLASNNFQRDASSVCMESYSMDGKVKALLVKGKTSKSEPGAELQQFIEIWSSNCLVKSFNVKEQFEKKHGTINDDTQFASFQLSSDGTRLMYVAEKKVPETCSFFKKTPKTEGEEKDKSDEKIPGKEYLYCQSWGEQLSTVVSPVVAILDIATEICTIVECPDDVSCGRAVWLPGSNNQLVFVGYNNDPIKFGFIYCFNRRSKLYYANLDSKKTVSLSSDDSMYIFSPRFNPQGTKLVYMDCEGIPPQPHRSCARIRIVDWASKAVSTLVDIVNKPTENGFTGVYSLSFTERCWSNDGSTLYYHDMQKTSTHIMSIDTRDGTVNCLTDKRKEGTYNVFDVFDGLLLGRYADPAHPMNIFVARIPSGDNKLFAPSDFCQIANSTDLEFSNISYKVMDFERDQGGFPYQAIYMSPSSPLSPPPLIVFSHGGPHVGFTPDFMQWNACFVTLGYAILMVNYNGSTGFGQDFITSLLGKVGTLEIMDIQYAVESLVKNELVDKNRIFAHGGSHGGFISTHLIGQFPDYYRAAFIRNPVIDMAAMRNDTDIPDWDYTVSGLPYDPSAPPTNEVYTKLLSLSPIVHAHKIKAPVVLAIGSEDLRCPPSQGRELYLLLKSRGTDVKMFVYPKDSHPLISVDTDADCFMNCALLFHENSN